jgi:hypothetical protein
VLTIGQDLFAAGGANIDLASHTPDVGAVWTEETATKFTVINTDGAVRHDATTDQRARKGDDLGSDAMSVSLDVKLPSNATRKCGVCARMSTDGFGDQFEAYISGTGTPDLFLRKLVGGVATQLATVADVLATGTFGTLQLIARTIAAGAAELLVFVNGVLQISFVESTDPMNGRQYAGILMNGNSATTTEADNFLSQRLVSLVHQMPPMAAHLVR